MSGLEMFFSIFVQFGQDIRHRSLLDNNNVQYGNRYYLGIRREIMLDKIDKMILAQLGKNVDYHHKNYEKLFKMLDILLQTEEFDIEYKN